MVEMACTCRATPAGATRDLLHSWLRIRGLFEPTWKRIGALGRNTLPGTSRRHRRARLAQTLLRYMTLGRRRFNATIPPSRILVDEKENEDGEKKVSEHVVPQHHTIVHARLVFHAIGGLPRWVSAVGRGDER